MLRLADEDLLKRSPVYRAIGARAMRLILHNAYAQALPVGTKLFHQGEEARFLHFVLSGRVSLLANVPGERDTVIEILAAGEALVAPAAILHLPYLVSAQVTVPARILFIPVEDFRAALAAEPSVALAMAELLARHWRVLVRQIKDLKLRSGAQRLAAYLLAIAKPGNGSTVVELPEPRQTVAARLGMTRENLSRAFARLRRLGVSGRGREVRIENIAELRQFSAYDDQI
jgi:CRP/FNR family transcriptional regulator, transcriptional activator FtrB